jgi:2-polyprenyl-3-methyl-5-hydroxy-6-metoxy-1,4-benzoquinol methylase
MDDPSLDAAEHRRALDGLARINRISGTAGTLWPSLVHAAREAGRSGRTLRVLDVACGGGDIAVALSRRARNAKLPVRIDGCDLSGIAIDRAIELSRRHQTDGDFFACDAIRTELPDGYDAIVCSLFLHHLNDEEARSILENMSRHARLVLVSDLLRSRAAWALTWLGTRLLSRSPVVHTDGPRSVEGAFTLNEVGTLLEEAGMNTATIERVWPMRMLVTWRSGHGAAEGEQTR